jgi:hypothetical protein
LPERAYSATVSTTMTDYKQRKKGSVVAKTAGIMRNDLPKLTPREEHEAAEQAIAEEAIKRMGG